MARRSMKFNDTLDFKQTSEEAVPDSEAQVERPAPVVERLRTAQSRKKRERERSWEKAHPSKVYRKVPNEIRDAITQIADAWGYTYTTSQVAQAFLEYALMCFRRGDFSLDLELDPRYGLTLMPGGWSDEKKPIWAENLTPKKNQPKKPKKKKPKTPLHDQVVGYRLTPELVEEIERVCETRRGPDGRIIRRTYHDGEVVARFLAHAIEAYNSGRLSLKDPAEQGKEQEYEQKGWF
ncbi:MAG: hypothetical protein D6743_19170 [Calditrichaeota bacterium]|nr:MAG: hypothetical protein D6743_19170 [Calditrichota bacterium]